MILIKLGIAFCYLHIAALGTTDILRLLKGSNTALFTVDSVCDSCGHKIPLWHQIPILSFIIDRGKCKYCGVKIKPANFFLELFPFLYYITVSVILDFSVFSVFVCFVSYELLKLTMIIIRRRKEKHFFRDYALSFFSNVFIFLLIAFLACLYEFTFIK